MGSKFLGEPDQLPARKMDLPWGQARLCLISTHLKLSPSREKLSGHVSCGQTHYGAQGRHRLLEEATQLFPNVEGAPGATVFFTDRWQVNLSVPGQNTKPFSHDPWGHFTPRNRVSPSVCGEADLEEEKDSALSPGVLSPEAVNTKCTSCHRTQAQLTPGGYLFPCCPLLITPRFQIIATPSLRHQGQQQISGLTEHGSLWQEPHSFLRWGRRRAKPGKMGIHTWKVWEIHCTCDPSRREDDPG